MVELKANKYNFSEGDQGGKSLVLREISKSQKIFRLPIFKSNPQRKKLWPLNKLCCKQIAWIRNFVLFVLAHGGGRRHLLLLSEGWRQRETQLFRCFVVTSLSPNIASSAFPPFPRYIVHRQRYWFSVRICRDNKHEGKG